MSMESDSGLSGRERLLSSMYSGAVVEAFGGAAVFEALRNSGGSDAAQALPEAPATECGIAESQDYKAGR